jgi:hypothetical protein
MHLSSISDGHASRLHARSLPLNSRESEEHAAQGAALRAGQEEGIQSLLCVAPRAPVNPVNPVRRFRPFLELIAWIVFAAWFLSVSAYASLAFVVPPSGGPLSMSTVHSVVSEFASPDASALRPSTITHQPSTVLAQLPAAEPSQIGAWLVSASAVLSAAALARQFRRKTPIEAEFLTRKEFQDFKDKDFADLRNRVDQSFRSLSDKLDGINERLHDVRSLVDRLDERTKHQTTNNH